MSKSQIFLALAAIGGGFVAMVAHPKPRTATQRFVFMLCGLITAAFTGPYVAHRFNLIENTDLLMVYFAIGALWNSIFDKAIEFLGSFRLPMGGK